MSDGLSGCLSDTRFDGMHIYRLMSAGQAVYNVCGQYLHLAKRPNPARYEIRGNYIYRTYRARSTLEPQFKIIGDKIRNLHSTGQAVYEIRA